MKAITCFECKRILKELLQYETDRGYWVIEGYCNDCNCYTARHVEIDDSDLDEDEEKEIPF